MAEKLRSTYSRSKKTFYRLLKCNLHCSYGQLWRQKILRNFSSKIVFCEFFLCIVCCYSHILLCSVMIIVAFLCPVLLISPYSSPLTSPMISLLISFIFLSSLFFFPLFISLLSPFLFLPLFSSHLISFLLISFLLFSSISFLLFLAPQASEVSRSPAGVSDPPVCGGSTAHGTYARTVFGSVWLTPIGIRLYNDSMRLKFFLLYYYTLLYFIIFYRRWGRWREDFSKVRNNGIFPI